MSATATTEPRRRLSLVPRTRRSRVAVGVALLLAVPLTAWAVYLYLLGITGTLDARALKIEWQGTPVVSAEDGLTCSAAAVSTNNLSVTAAGYPGGSCTVTADTYADSTSAEGARVVGVTATAPTGWSLELDPASCGSQLTKGGTAVPVSFSVVSAESGGLADGSLSAAGLQLVPESQWDPALCTP